MKHKFIVFGRIIKTGFQNFIRNATLAVAAMAVMVITLTIVLLSVIANATFTNTIKQLTDKIDISVYLKDSVTQDQTNKLIGDFKNLSNVKDVSYLSKDAALEAYKKQNQNNLDLLLAISQTDNPLPATIRIKPRDPNRLQEIKDFIDKPEIKALQSDQSNYSGDRKDAVDKIAKATKFLREAGFAGVIVFGAVSMLIIFNTIRMAIFNRREELNIMRLLGAGNWYIRGPFVVETIIYGLISAAISITLCNSLFIILAKTFEASSLGLLDISYANSYFAHYFWIILLVQIGLGILIGAASSFIATRRYLKFKTSK
jgi:cell division transport system permease protein